MKFTTTTLAAATLALTSAAPCDSPFTTDLKPNQPFRIMAIRSGSDLQYASVQALSNGLRINNPSQGASCGPDPRDYATFYINDSGDLYLYTANPPQQIYVDRSGMGQGIIQYTTGVQGIGKNQERGPFSIKDGELVFDNRNGEPTYFQACPGANGGGYSVWLSGVANPGGNKDCVGFKARILKEENAEKCSYTAQ